MNKYYETFIFKTDIESKLTTSYITESINNLWNDVINNNKIFCKSNNLVQITYKIKFYILYYPSSKRIIPNFFTNLFIKFKNRYKSKIIKMN